MRKLYLCLLCTLLAPALADDTPLNEALFVSPVGITRETEVHQALSKIQSKIVIADTTYQYQNINYTITNATVQTIFIDSKQRIEITGNDQIKVSGGRIEFAYQFNFSKAEGSTSSNGYAYGSASSESFNYTKELFPLEDGHIHWTLFPGADGYSNLTFGDPFSIKRMQPYNETDYGNILVMLDQATTLIQPQNVKQQLLEAFNTEMPETLNSTLHKYVIESQIPYTFHSPTHGQIGMKIQHSLHDFDIDPTAGYKVIYFTQIEGEPDPCEGYSSVPLKHLLFQNYGSSQQIHTHCLYTSVVQYMQKKGWLDIKLDSSWECNAFQFYAGDLFDLINNLYLSVKPRELLEGDCKASANGIEMKQNRQLTFNTYDLNLEYSCVVNTRNMEVKSIQVMDFKASVRFLISAYNSKTELNVQIISAEALDLSFKPVGNFYVSNLALAMFKVNQILMKLSKNKVFGNGYPLRHVEFPKTHIDQNYTVYYNGQGHNSLSES